ncbi:DNA gyrase inhibitor YacG [Azospirillum sp.]|uniref:DNA gyrase inhibitor YacG n=1 Tax=Azospirillum sp. TaxID=34012 RepID=UPI002D4A3877|nr:DNA gyrase inhibitor YacG [Azospirillum sp.]HYD68529.1 DNA gyrase inhibitor YacG [Azospirillum sp.]
MSKASKGGCPICGRPEEAAFRPFCSKRCADVDLSRWLGGVYRVETEEPPEGPGKNVGSDDE